MELAHIRKLGPARVFTPTFVMRLAEANRAARQLRDLGCRVISQAVGDCEKPTEIVVDRNPHRRLAGCPSVHVTCAPVGRHV